VLKIEACWRNMSHDVQLFVNQYLKLIISMQMILLMVESWRAQPLVELQSKVAFSSHRYRLQAARNAASSGPPGRRFKAVQSTGTMKRPAEHVLRHERRVFLSSRYRASCVGIATFPIYRIDRAVATPGARPTLEGGLSQPPTGLRSHTSTRWLSDAVAGSRLHATAAAGPIPVAEMSFTP